MKEAILSPCAHCDADQAREWYESRENGLGYDFIHALDEALSRICRSPNAYRRVGRVFHTSRNPRELRKRVGEND